MPFGPDQEPSAEMTKMLIKGITELKPGLTMNDIMKIVATAEWDFSVDPARVSVRIDEEPQVVEVNIVAAPKH